MRICPTCGVCYEDRQESCDGRDHYPLEFHRPGTRLIGNKYQLEQRLGGGNTGIVYASTHQALKKQRAIKLLKPDFAKTDPDGRIRLQREALTVCNFDHINVVRLYDFGLNQVAIGENGQREFYDELYLAMELLEGQTLKTFLTRSSRLPVLEAVEIAIQIAAGLSEVHAHDVIHRDLKPANLMITYDRHGNRVLKIIDFGSVKLVGQPEASMALDLTGQMFIGSPQYASPEMCCSRPIDFRSDIYSLGLILYEMLAGGSPFAALDFLGWLNQHAYVTPRPLTGVPRELEALTMKILSKDPDERPQTAPEVVSQLEQVKAAHCLPKESVNGEEVSQPTDHDETVVVDESFKASIKPVSSAGKKDHPPLNDNAIRPKVVFVLSVTASLFFTLNVLRMSYRYRASHHVTEAVAAENDPNPQEQEFVTVTDVNIRAFPSASSDRVGLAAKGSRVRVLSRQDKWCEIIVVRHGRTKNDPDSEDKGWVISEKLTPASGV